MASQQTSKNPSPPPKNLQNVAEVHLKQKAIQNGGSNPHHTNNRLSKRVRAIEESAAETGNPRTQDFIESLNTLLSPFDIEFGDYSTMEFFRTNTESSDRALDIWKNFLWEWSTERALPFETNHKHKYHC
jgi:hypothetical protein